MRNSCNPGFSTGEVDTLQASSTLEAMKHCCAPCRSSKILKAPSKAIKSAEVVPALGRRPSDTTAQTLVLYPLRLVSHFRHIQNGLFQKIQKISAAFDVGWEDPFAS